MKIILSLALFLIGCSTPDPADNLYRALEADHGKLSQAYIDAANRHDTLAMAATKNRMVYIDSLFGILIRGGELKVSEQ